MLSNRLTGMVVLLILVRHHYRDNRLAGVAGSAHGFEGDCFMTAGFVLEPDLERKTLVLFSAAADGAVQHP